MPDFFVFIVNIKMDKCIEEIIERIEEFSLKWHKEDLKIFEWESPQLSEEENISIKLLYHNYQTWHLIDLYKIDPGKITHDSHGIPHNKMRNNSITELDNLLLKHQIGKGKMHSETIGDIIDKISIMFIKLLHLEDGNKKKTVQIHYDILVHCAKELWKEIRSGDRQCPFIERFKV